jgi:hypothetical protein
MSEFNQRQYGLMLDRLNAFEKGTLNLDRLVVDLEGLLNALQGIASSWKQTFLIDWGKLEDERAYASFKNICILDEETSERIRQTVSELKLSVLEKMDDPADRPRSGR